jgi:hypothetical protein
VWVREGVEVGLAAEKMAEAEVECWVEVGVGKDERERNEVKDRRDRRKVENVEGEEEVDEANLMEQTLGTERSFC